MKKLKFLQKYSKFSFNDGSTHFRRSQKKDNSVKWDRENTVPLDPLRSGEIKTRSLNAHFPIAPQINNQKGQSLIEYLILVGIIGVGTISVVSVLGGNLNRKLAVINAGLIGSKYSEKNGEEIKEKALKNRNLGNFLNGAQEKREKSPE